MEITLKLSIFFRHILLRVTVYLGPQCFQSFLKRFLSKFVNRRFERRNFYITKTFPVSLQNKIYYIT